MQTERLLTVLRRSGFDLSPTEVAEALWLASHAGPFSGPRARPVYAPDGTAADQRPDAPTGERPEDGAAADRVPVRLPATQPGLGVTAASVAIRGPDAPALPRSGDIARALRPFKRRVAGSRETELDEPATMRRIADSGIWIPVLTAAPERWFDVALIVDAGESVQVWSALVAEFRALLERMNAFRDVRLWYLRPRGNGVGIATAATGPPGAVRGPAELIDPTRRRTYLVLTDGASDAWHGGAALDALAIWGRHGPVAVLQPLPERLWNRTGLAPRSGRVSATAPGSANARLQFRDRRRRPPRTGEVTLLPVPVLEVDPTWLAAWTRLVTGAAAAGVDLAVSLVHRGDGHEAPSAPAAPTQESPQESIARFRATASPEAYRLATLLAVAPLNLAVVRLVQHLMLPGSGPTALAELLLSGVVERVGESDDAYDFRPGLRDLLLDDLRRSEADQVLAAVSRYLAQRSGVPGRAFDAAALLPGGTEATVSRDALGWLPESVVHRLWGRPAGHDVAPPASAPPTTAPEPAPPYEDGTTVREPIAADPDQEEVDRLADILRHGDRPDLLAATTRQLVDRLHRTAAPVDLRLTGATLIDFRASTRIGIADFERTTFIGAAVFTDAVFTGPANFREATFDAGATFGGATFTGVADFYRAVFWVRADFAGATFRATADFSAAFVDGVADFTRAYLHGPALFDRTRFDGTIAVRDAVFAAGQRSDTAQFRDGVDWSVARVEPLRLDPGLWYALTGRQPDHDEDEDDPDDEPPIQRVSPGDAVAVARMSDNVLVVDGRPRYHLRGCINLLGRDSEELPVSEAVGLGFTPCADCAPVDTLIARNVRVEPVVPVQRDVLDDDEDDDDQDPVDEPTVERTEPADLALVARLPAPVLVIDGRPRYHLRGCVHLLGRFYEELPVSEAVELGFTPCDLCRPVSGIIARKPWADLTPREREVLALIADNQSNGSIAQRLRVAEKTVNAHVIDVFAKLDVYSRSEAAGVVLGRRTAPPPPAAPTEPDDGSSTMPATDLLDDRSDPAQGGGVTIRVSDLQRSTAFYRDVLGLAEVATDDESTLLLAGHTRVLLTRAAHREPPDPRIVQLNIEVEDLDATYVELRTRGVDFVHRPRVVSEGEQLELRAAVLRDPDGHAIALNRWELRRD